MAPRASLYALLADAIDYAGLFPPASLGMQAAVEQYATHHQSEDVWALGHFVLPAARLEELVRERAQVQSDRGPWRLSVLLGDDPMADIRHATAVAESHRELLTIDSAEIRIAPPNLPNALVEIVNRPPSAVALFVEIPSDTDVATPVRALQAARACAKIRTGGVTEEAFPERPDVVRFIRRCAEHGVAFKATAGLHHPLRARHRLTYESNAAVATMHGFLNVLVTATFIYAGATDDQALAMMSAEEPDAFRFDDEGIKWKDCFVATEQVRESRRAFARSFGSCSFIEPISDLRELALL